MKAALLQRGQSQMKTTAVPAALKPISKDDVAPKSSDEAGDKAGDKAGDQTDGESSGNFGVRALPFGP